MTDLCKYRLISPVSAGESEDLLDAKSQEEGVRRVQALFADWLRMENVVVLAGAGCGVGAGGRLMTGSRENNLECLVLDAVEKCKLSDAARAVLQWKKENDFGRGNFESWLSYLFNASRLVDDPQSPLQSVLWRDNADVHSKDLKRLCDLIQNAIFAECALEINRAELSDEGKTETSGHIPFLAKWVFRHFGG